LRQKDPDPVASDDHVLMLRTAEGDFIAFEKLVSKYQQSILNLACRFLGDPVEAEDIAQETFLRVFEAAKRYDNRATFRTWLFTITKRLCFDHVRKRKPGYIAETPEIAGGDVPYERLEANETQQYVRQAIASLPENQRMAVLLQHYEGLSYAEVANVLGVSQSAVESLLVRAKRTLRKRLSVLVAVSENARARSAGIRAEDRVIGMEKT
jgi:RNA polymerase sigma-70 factor (ECF subfamily)